MEFGLTDDIDKEEKAMIKRIHLLMLFVACFLIPAVSFASNKGITEDRVKAQMGSLSIPFIKNTGQIEKDAVSFYARTFGGTVYVTRSGEIVYSLPVNEDNAVPRNERLRNLSSNTIKGLALKEELVGSKGLY